MQFRDGTPCMNPRPRVQSVCGRAGKDRKLCTPAHTLATYREKKEERRRRREGKRERRNGETKKSEGGGWSKGRGFKWKRKTERKRENALRELLP